MWTGNMYVSGYVVKYTIIKGGFMIDDIIFFTVALPTLIVVSQVIIIIGSIID